MAENKSLSALTITLALLAYPAAWIMGGGSVEEKKLTHFSPGGKYVIRHYYPARFYFIFNESPGYIKLYRISDGKMLYESQIEDFSQVGAPIDWGNGGDASKPLEISIGMSIWVPFTLPPE